MERIAKNEKYKAKVDTYRKEKTQEALDYESAPSSNVHEFHSVEATWGMDLIDSLVTEDFPEESVEEEAPKINFNGFRQAYFEASEESNQREVSSLRLGTHKDQ